MPRPVEGHRRQRVGERVEETRRAAHGRLAGGSAALRISPSGEAAAMARRAPAPETFPPPRSGAPPAKQGDGGIGGGAPPPHSGGPPPRVRPHHPHAAGGP